jgi:hypothetical protein
LVFDKVPIFTYLRVPVLVRGRRIFGVRIVFVAPVIVPVGVTGGIGFTIATPEDVEPERVAPERVAPVRAPAVITVPERVAQVRVDPVRTVPERVVPERVAPVRVVVTPVPDSSGDRVLPVLATAPVLARAPVCTATTTGVGVLLTTGATASILLVLVGGNTPRV